METRKLFEKISGEKEVKEKRKMGTDYFCRQKMRIVRIVWIIW